MRTSRKRGAYSVERLDVGCRRSDDNGDGVLYGFPVFLHYHSARWWSCDSMCSTPEPKQMYILSMIWGHNVLRKQGQFSFCYSFLLWVQAASWKSPGNQRWGKTTEISSRNGFVIVLFVLLLSCIVCSLARWDRRWRNNCENCTGRLEQTAPAQSDITFCIWLLQVCVLRWCFRCRYAPPKPEDPQVNNPTESLLIWETKYNSAST